MNYDYTREELIDICERALKLQRPENWLNRDSPSAFEKTSTLLSYLKYAEDPTFEIRTEENTGSEYTNTNDRTLWVDIEVNDMEFGNFPTRFYLPHGDRLEESEQKDRDWY